jgi:ATP-dependent Lon protease
MTTAKPRPLLAPGETRAYPALPLRDIVVFPHMIAPLFVGRKKSILAVRHLHPARRPEERVRRRSDNGGDLRLASVLQLLKLPDGTASPSRASFAKFRSDSCQPR